MEKIWPFALIFIIGTAVLIYSRWKKKTRYEEPLWRLILGLIAVIILSVMFLTNDNLKPVGRIMAIVLCSTMFVLGTIKIVKKVRP